LDIKKALCRLCVVLSLSLCAKIIPRRAGSAPEGPPRRARVCPKKEHTSTQFQKEIFLFK
jgi:hypothetical protein